MFGCIDARDAGLHVASLTGSPRRDRIAPSADLRPVRRRHHPLAALARRCAWPTLHITSATPATA